MELLCALMGEILLFLLTLHPPQLKMTATNNVLMYTPTFFLFLISGGVCITFGLSGETIQSCGHTEGG